MLEEGFFVVNDRNTKLFLYLVLVDTPNSEIKLEMHVFGLSYWVISRIVFPDIFIVLYSLFRLRD